MNLKGLIGLFLVWSFIASLAAASPAYTIHTRTYLRASGGRLDIAGSSFQSSNAWVYANMRKADGLCRGSFSLNFKGESDTEKIMLRFSGRLDDGCYMTRDELFVNAKAHIYYRITPKRRRVVIGYNTRGYPIWKQETTGRRQSSSFRDYVVILMQGDTVSVYSDNFGVFNISVNSFTFRKY